jgi:hypothetical protein
VQEQYTGRKKYKGNKISCQEPKKRCSYKCYSNKKRTKILIPIPMGGEPYAHDPGRARWSSLFHWRDLWGRGVPPGAPQGRGPGGFASLLHLSYLSLRKAGTQHCGSRRSIDIPVYLKTPERPPGPVGAPGYRSTHARSQYRGCGSETG